MATSFSFLLVASAAILQLPFAQVHATTNLSGSILPKIDDTTWEGWSPGEKFAQQFQGWRDKRVPDHIQVWCKGFIPHNATSQTINGMPVMPIALPGGLPVPGFLGQCAGIDGRDWSNAAPDSPRPTDSRFWAWMEVARGRGGGVQTGANCGVSHNVCCDPKGCWGGIPYGEITCSKHCPDDQMQIKRLSCWSADGNNNTKWAQAGKSCSGGPILAVKAYIQGRGGNPCAEVGPIQSPAAAWDVGVAVFPTKRKVTITGYVDDAPSYECYARAKDDNVWGPTVTLAQVPIDLRQNIAIELAGYADRPINPDDMYFDLPEPARTPDTIVV